MVANPYAWNLTDLEHVPQNGLKVFSTFACGGGSSMGYKLAGFTMVGANDIDPEMRWHYEQNLNPKLFIEGPVKDLVTKDLPDELFDLDVLDGSPPCSTFSMSGSREKAWGREKHFREGQAVQVLDDLFFDFLDVVERLMPKVVVAENVKGMLAGNAKGYVHAVIQRLKQIGYNAQLFLVNAADCGVPQRRERVFFVASRADLNLPKLKFAPNGKWIAVKDALADVQELTEAEKQHTAPSGLDFRYWHLTKPGRRYLDTAMELENRAAYWDTRKLDPDMPAHTLTAGDGVKHWSVCRGITFREAKRLGSFPDDYKAKSENIGKYMVGMSVPPKMLAALAEQIAAQWFPKAGK